MCRTGTYHDFHGIGVANLIFGLIFIILPDHALYEEAAGAYENLAQEDLVKANDAITVINGIFLLGTGICCLVIARRWLENQRIKTVMYAAIAMAAVSILLCPITFGLNIITTKDAADWAYTTTNKDSSSSDDSSSNDSSSLGTSPPTEIDRSIQLYQMLTLFMYAARFLEYRYAISAGFAIIAFGSFFMNIALVLLIVRTKNFSLTNFTRPDEPQLDEVPAAIASAIRYQHAQDGGIAIPPLPEKPGLPMPTTAGMNHHTNGNAYGF